MRTLAKVLMSILLVTFFVSGCAYKTISHGEEISQADANEKIQRGLTTKQEIFLNFGEPTKTADNESVFFYSWTRGKKTAFMGIGSGDADANSLVIIFDDDDVVKDYRISRGAVDSGQVD